MVERGYIFNGIVKNVIYYIFVIVVLKGNLKGIYFFEDFVKLGVRVVFGDLKVVVIGKVFWKVFEKNGLWEEVKLNVVIFMLMVN